MPEIYEIYADEAWTHCNPPLNRYWCFYGGILGRAADLDRFDTALRAIKKKNNVKSEVKWSKLKEDNISCYKEMVDELMLYLRSGSIKYRQMFLDRAFVRIPEPGEPPITELDVQFKLYYQYIKHAFGLRYLPHAPDGTQVLLRLDNHSSQGHKDRLVSFCEELPGYLHRPDLTIRVTFVNSAKVPRLQVCDVLMGAAGSHGNKMFAKRAPGQRRITPKQKLRNELCKYIYEALKALDRDMRGSRAFNWFESTGKGGDPTNLFHHAMRIWKFEPSNYVIDRGWQNDHLDKFGNYVAPDVVRPPT